MASDLVPAESAYVLWTRRLVTVLAVGMSLFHLYIAYFGPPNAFILRSSHLGIALVLVYLSFPGVLKRGNSGPGVFDWIFVVASFAAAAYPITEQHYFNTLIAYVGPGSQTDLCRARPMLTVIR